MNDTKIVGQLTLEKIQDIITTQTRVMFNKNLELVENHNTFSAALYEVSGPSEGFSLETASVIVEETKNYRTKIISIAVDSLRTLYSVSVNKENILSLGVHLICNSEAEAVIVGLSFGQRYIVHTDYTGNFHEIEAWGGSGMVERFQQAPPAAEHFIKAYLEKV